MFLNNKHIIIFKLLKTKILTNNTIVRINGVRQDTRGFVSSFSSSFIKVLLKKQT